jgi:hypothetical protein
MCAIDGDGFTVELKDERAARVASIDDAQTWLDVEIRRTWPASAYAHSGAA